MDTKRAEEPTQVLNVREGALPRHIDRHEMKLWGKTGLPRIRPNHAVAPSLQSYRQPKE